jgi:hypothetical protein
MGELAEGNALFTYLIITGANPEFKTFLDILCIYRSSKLDEFSFG